MSNTAISFWSFIKKHQIVIPVIQRDYVQGRTDKTFIRRNFLKKIKEALDSFVEANKEPTPLTLDFIYGSEDKGCFCPLDGQQRLTTLWLLHWYIALRAGKLNNETDRETLSNFAYETREFSAKFCKELCKNGNFDQFSYPDTKIRDFVENQTWFYLDWKLDPTIVSMLTMLGGIDSCDALDNIESIFKNNSRDDFIKYWNCLTSDNSPIIFYYLLLNNFGLSDDLYVKMNARGKQLTIFEMFKADLVKYINQRSEEDKRWTKLADVGSGIVNKFDTTWMDIFWQNSSENSQFDETFYLFLNRFFWNELFTSKNENSDYLLKISESQTIEPENSIYNYLNQDNGKIYNGIDLYKFSNEEIPLETFLKLEKVLDGYNDYVKKRGNLPMSVWWAQGFEFIPKQSEQKFNIEGINQVQRVAFYAICKYFSEPFAPEHNKDISFKRWMRVVWNLISGESEDGKPELRSTSTIRAAIKLLEKLDSHNVYASLKQQTIDNKDSVLGKRWEEEVIKAKKILNDEDQLAIYTGDAKKSDGSDYTTWEDLIIDAESWSFFKGSIRFLYLDAKDNVNWTDFDKKFKNVRCYFVDKTKTEKIYDIPKVVNENLFPKATLLRGLINRCRDLSIFNKRRIFNNHSGSWLSLLLDDKLREPVHNFLMGNWYRLNESATQNRHLWQLSQTNLLDLVVSEIPNSWINPGYYHFAIHQKSRNGVMLDTEYRDSFLLNNEDIIVDTEHRRIKLIDNMEDTRLLYGLDINFRYKNSYFQWYRNDTIYLMEPIKINSDGTKCCFATKDPKTGNYLSKKDIFSKLDELILYQRNQTTFLS